MLKRREAKTAERMQRPASPTDGKGSEECDGLSGTRSGGRQANRIACFVHSVPVALNDLHAS